MNNPRNLAPLFRQFARQNIPRARYSFEQNSPLRRAGSCCYNRLSATSARAPSQFGCFTRGYSTDVFPQGAGSIKQRFTKPKKRGAPLDPQLDGKRSAANARPRFGKRIAVSLAIFIGSIVIVQVVWVPRTIKADSDLSKQIGDKKIVVVKEETIGGDPDDTVPSGTSSVPPLPKRMYLPSSSKDPATALLMRDQKSEVLEEYTLVGHGIRTVSFLSIQVYVVALYVATASLPELQAALLNESQVPPGATTATLPERQDLRKRLLDDEAGHKFFDKLLEMSNVKMALRLVPTRNTDYAHLRDGLTKGINARVRLNPEPYNDNSFADTMQEFKALMGGKRSLAKGATLVLARGALGELNIYVGPAADKKKKKGDTTPMTVQAQVSGGGKTELSTDGLISLGKEIKDDRITRALYLCYLTSKPASEGARQSIVDGLVEAVERPVGSTSGQVV